MNQVYDVVIVDDHELYSYGAKMWLSRSGNINVTATCTCGAQVLEYLASSRPHLILLDIKLPDMNGFDVLRLITEQFPEIKVIAVTFYDDGPSVEKMLGLGATGYITKDTGLSSFDEAIDRVMHGEIYMSHRAAVNYATYSLQSSQTRFSEREMDIIRHIVKGMTDKEIGVKLGLSVRTIGAHKRRIMNRMKVQKSTEIVSYAYRMKLV